MNISKRFSSTFHFDKELLLEETLQVLCISSSISSNLKSRSLKLFFLEVLCFFFSLIESKIKVSEAFLSFHFWQIAFSWGRDLRCAFLLNFFSFQTNSFFLRERLDVLRFFFNLIKPYGHHCLRSSAPRLRYFSFPRLFLCMFV